MGIVMTTSPGDLDAHLQKQIERRLAALLVRLNFIGVTCVNEARTARTYTPRSNALLNSTGYVIVKDGVIIDGSSFQGNGGTDGEAYARKLTARYSQGITLIVVAGENYAAYVEALGYNVLASAELLAEQLVPRMMKSLGFKK